MPGRVMLSVHMRATGEQVLVLLALARLPELRCGRGGFVDGGHAVTSAGVEVPAPDAAAARTAFTMFW